MQIYYKPDPPFESLNQQEKDSINWLVSTWQESNELYTKSKREKGFISYKRSTKENMVLLRVVMEYDEIPAEDLINILENHEISKAWQNQINNIEVLGRIDNHSDIVYFTIPNPGLMIERRDFVCRRIVLKDHLDYAYVSVMRQSEHPLKPLNSRFIRGKMDSGFLIERTGQNSCRQKLVAQLDFGGMIPRWVVNMKCEEGPYSEYTSILKFHSKIKNSRVFEHIYRVVVYF